MPSCCKGKGRRPAVKIYRSGKDKTWWAIVGSSMLTDYTSREELEKDAKRLKNRQRVLACGHVVNEDAAVIN